MQDHTPNTQDPTSRPATSLRASVEQQENEAQIQGYRARVGVPLEVFRIRAVSTVARVREHVSSGTLRQDAGAFFQRAQQSGQRALGDRLQRWQRRQTLTSDVSTRQESSLADLEREAEGHREQLGASLKVLRERADAAMAEVRELISPDALRLEAAAYTRRARRTAAKALTDRMRRRPLGTAALGAGLTLSVWNRIRAAPASLLLTGAGAAALLRGGIERNRAECPDQKISKSTRDEVSVSAPHGQVVAARPTPRFASAMRAAEPVFSHPPQMPRATRAAMVRTKRSPPTSVMTSIRNDVLVRTALDRPVLVGAATMALGALIGLVSSTEAPERSRTQERRRRPAERQNAAAPNLGTPASAMDASHPDEPAAASNASELEENGGVGAEAEVVGSLVSNVVSAMAEEAEMSGASRSKSGELAIELTGATDSPPNLSDFLDTGATATALLMQEQSEVSDQRDTLPIASTTSQSKAVRNKAGIQRDVTTGSASEVLTNSKS